jgi:uncharacterized protein YecT (DUF1311 family)
MRKWILSTLFVLVLPATAQAQDGLIFDIGYTKACLQRSDSAEARRACIGKSADICMSTSPGGESTYGMGGCLSYEAEWWDEQLNIAYKALMRQEKANDSANGAGSNGPQSAAKALREAQRAWIPFRDAVCSYEYAQWGGGTGGGPASAACFLRMTGEQTLYLQSAGFGG